MTRETAAQATGKARKLRTSNLGVAMKLATDESRLDRTRYEYRWINDNNARLHQMAGPDFDDWAICTQSGGEVKADATDLGAAISVVTGVKKTGEPMRSYLCRKPIEWAIEDRARREQERRKVDDQIRTLASERATGVDPGKFYNPSPTGRNIVA